MSGPSSQKANRKKLRQKAKDTLDRLARKTPDEVLERKEDLTKSQKDIQKLENLLDAAQVGNSHSLVYALMYLPISDSGETFWSKIICARLETSVVPDPILFSSPTSCQEHRSSSQDPFMDDLRGETHPYQLTICFFSYLLCLLFQDLKMKRF